MMFAAEFRDLYKRYAGGVYRFALILCGDTMEAEDLTAGTYRRAMRKQLAEQKGTILTHFSFIIDHKIFNKSS